MNRNHRNSFLQTVRTALGHPGDLPRQAPCGLFPTHPSETSLASLERIHRRGESDRNGLIRRLEAAAEPIHLDIHRVKSAPAATAVLVEKIVSSPTEWGGPRQVCAWDHPLIDALELASRLAEHDIPVVSSAAFIPPGAGPMPAGQRMALRQGIADSFVGITAADLCVADTATLVTRARPGQPRSVSLVPSIHIAVITADRIVADFKELYAALRWRDPSHAVGLTNCLTFITGPSKTADIEATLVHGAHGPREMALIVIDAQ